MISEASCSAEDSSHASGAMRQMTGSSPFQEFTASGIGRPAILSELTVFCERAPSCRRTIARAGSTEIRSASENTCPPAARPDCATRLVMGSGIEALAFRVQERRRHDGRLAAAVEVVDRNLLAVPRAAAAQERKRDRLAEPGGMRGGGSPTAGPLD